MQRKSQTTWNGEPRFGPYDDPARIQFADENGRDLPPESPAEPGEDAPLFAEEPVEGYCSASRADTSDEAELFADEEDVRREQGQRVSYASYRIAAPALALGTVMLVVGLLVLASAGRRLLVQRPTLEAGSPQPAQSAVTAPPPAPVASDVSAPTPSMIERHASSEIPPPSAPRSTPAAQDVPVPASPPAPPPALPLHGRITELTPATIQLAPPQPSPAARAAAPAMPSAEVGFPIPEGAAEMPLPGFRESGSDSRSGRLDARDETATVREVLAKYVTAYGALDARAVAAVWPTVDRAALDRAFDALLSQNISFRRCSVTVSGATARAMCAGTAVWTPKIGGKKSREDERTWTFALAQRDDAWAIVSAEMR